MTAKTFKSPISLIAFESQMSSTGLVLCLNDSQLCRHYTPEPRFQTNENG